MNSFLIKLNKISIAVPIAMTVAMLFLHFISGAIEAGRIEMTEKRMEKLTQLSFAELGKIKVVRL